MILKDSTKYGRVPHLKIIENPCVVAVDEKDKRHIMVQQDRQLLLSFCTKICLLPHDNHLKLIIFLYILIIFVDLEKAFKTCILSVDLEKAFFLFKRYIAKSIEDIFRFHKISFDTLNTLVTRKYRLSKSFFSFFSFKKLAIIR